MKKNSDLELFQNAVVSSLLILANGKLNRDVAESIVSVVYKNIDTDCPVLMHKGANWYAKELLNMLKL